MAYGAGGPRGGALRRRGRPAHERAGRRPILHWGSAADHYVEVVHGRTVSEQFFEGAVRPIVEPILSGVGYLAGRLGSGSDVLGFDDARSTDHDYGCRLTVLVDDEHRDVLADLDAALEAGLPAEIAGWPTRFATTWDGRSGHKVDLHTVHDFASSRLGFDLRTPLQVAQWLCLTGQSVLEVIGGPVFHDKPGEYASISCVLDWYPADPLARAGSTDAFSAPAAQRGGDDRP